jgi:rhamnosyltransferase subunit B
MAGRCDFDRATNEGTHAPTQPGSGPLGNSKGTFVGCILLNMSKILICCWGSHGDVDPYIGLGLGLLRRGHRVTLAAQGYFGSLVQQSGLAFQPLRPNVGPTDTELVRRIMDPKDGSRFVTQEVVFKATAEMYEDLSAVAEWADLIITHPLTGVAAVHAERQGKPWASTVLSPLSFLSEHEPPVFSQATWLKRLEFVTPWPSRLFIRAGKKMSRVWCQPLLELRARLGLPDRGNPLFEGQHSPHLVLALWSRIFGAPQADWPNNVVVTGSMFYDASHGASLNERLEEFVSSGERPIVFTLGTSAVLNAGTFWRESAAAVERLGARAVFLVGKGQAQHALDLPSNVLAVEFAPHSLLMPRASVVVHQCGAGTVAQGLRSGRPILAVPFANDQPDNAWRITRLGTARTLRPSAYAVDRVVSELRQLLLEPRYAQNARHVSDVVRQECGVEAACEALVSTFGLN